MTTTQTARPAPLPRSHRAQFQAITARWRDNGVYGRINNLVHHSFFDTAVNDHPDAAGALDIHAGTVIGLGVQTHCNDCQPMAFAQTVHAGLRVARRGRFRVRHEVGLFTAAAPLAAAVEHFGHVDVHRCSRRPAALPGVLLAALLPLQTTPLQTRP